MCHASERVEKCILNRGARTLYEYRIKKVVRLRGKRWKRRICEYMRICAVAYEKEGERDSVGERKRKRGWRASTSSCSSGWSHPPFFSSFPTYINPFSILYIRVRMWVSHPSVHASMQPRNVALNSMRVPDWCTSTSSPPIVFPIYVRVREGRGCRYTIHMLKYTLCTYTKASLLRGSKIYLATFTYIHSRRYKSTYPGCFPARCFPAICLFATMRIHSRLLRWITQSTISCFAACTHPRACVYI